MTYNMQIIALFQHHNCKNGTSWLLISVIHLLLYTRHIVLHLYISFWNVRTK